MMKKIILAFVNILKLGLGFALIGKLKKALLLVVVASLIFTFGGIFDLLATFNGMIITYGLIAVVYIYTFCISFREKDIKFIKPIKNFLLYIILSFIITFSCAYPIRKYMYQFHISNYTVEGIMSKGDYIVSKQKDGKMEKPLYIFWSEDKSKIGRKINLPSLSEMKEIEKSTGHNNPID